MPTALELKREGWKPYIEAASRRSPLPPPTAAEKQERERVLARARTVADALKNRFDVQHVIVFGSLAQGGWFTSNSDVDLAVAGLATADFWDAWRVAEEIMADRSVDLIQLEEASAGLRRAIERHGIEL